MSILAEQTIIYDDFLKMNLSDEPYEIINGRRNEMSPSGFAHSKWVIEIGYILKNTLKDTGHILGGEIGILIRKNPLTIRCADVAFISNERVKEEITGILETVPEIVFEIYSQDAKAGEIEDKLKDYFEIGIENIVIFYYDTETLTLYEKSGKNEYKMRFLTVNNEFEIFKGIKIKLK